MEKIPQLVANAMLGITDNKNVMLLVVNNRLLILGCFMDTSSIQLVFVPIVCR
jgi:TRAP-type C4-dicarboxylate transport system permease large subunit